MELEIRTWLYDIHNAIEEIESFIGPGQNFTSFEADLKTKRAVERNLAIIGEAMSRILDKDGSIELSNAKKFLIPGIVLFMVTIRFQQLFFGILLANTCLSLRRKCRDF